MRFEIRYMGYAGYGIWDMVDMGYGDMRYGIWWISDMGDMGYGI